MSRQLNQYENFLVKKFNLQPQRFTSGGRTAIFDGATLDAADAKYRVEYEAAQAAKKAEEAARTAARVADDSAYFTSAEFRQEVIDELVAGGATLEQATNRTRDQLRLFNEARELGLM